MKSSLKIVALSFVVELLALATHAQTLVAYDFNNQTTPTATLTASTLASHVTAGLFSVSDGGFTSTNFTTATPPNSPAVSDSGSWNAASPTKYFAFTITPDSGYALSITNISFDYRQTGSGALNYQVDIGASTNLASGAFTQDSTWRSVSSSITLSALTVGTEVRVYGFNGGTAAFSIDRVTIAGTTTAIPEPSTYAAIFGAAALAAAAWHRRRQRAAR